MNTSKLLLLLILAFLTSQLAMAQHIFKGTVVDSATLQPLECACIHVGGKLCGCNKEGYFQVSLPTDTATLSITYIGFTTQVLTVKHSDGTVSIRMNRG